MAVATCPRCEGSLAYADEGHCTVCSNFCRHPQILACTKCHYLYCFPCIRQRSQQPGIPAHLRPAPPRPPAGPGMMHSGGEV
jgi:hypothetical protein